MPEGARGGKGATFDRAYRQFRPGLVRYALLAGADDPEGVADLALFDTYKALTRGRFANDTALRAYAYRAARSQLIGEARRPVPVPILDDGLPELAADDEIDKISDQAAIDGYLGELTPDQERVVRGLFFEDKTAEALGLELGRDRNAIYQLRHRGMERLRASWPTAIATILLLLGILALARSWTDTSISNAPADQPTDVRQDGAPPSTRTPGEQDTVPVLDAVEPTVGADSAQPTPGEEGVTIDSTQLQPSAQPTTGLGGFELDVGPETTAGPTQSSSPQTEIPAAPTTSRSTTTQPPSTNAVATTVLTTTTTTTRPTTTTSTVRTTTTLHQSGLVPGRIYTIRLQPGGRCLDVPIPADLEGTQPHMWNCSPTLNRQHWRFEATDDHSFEIVNAASGLALTLDEPALVNGSPIVVDRYQGLDRQRWYVVPQPDGTYRLDARSGSWKTLTANGTANGDPLSGWNINPDGLDRQYWYLEDVGG